MGRVCSWLLLSVEAVLIAIAGGTMVWEQLGVLACLACLACEAVQHFV